MNVNINDGANYAMPAPYASQSSTAPSVNSTVPGASDKTEASSTNDKTQVNKNKRRQPKYRATKRPQSERRFQCDQCESRFFTQKDVKRHMVVHTGIRNFACPFCTQRFGRKDHLVRHAKKSHDQDTRSFRRRTGSSSPASTPIDPKKVAKRAGRAIKKEPDGGVSSAPLPPMLTQYESSAPSSTVPTTTSFGLVPSDTRFVSDVRNSATSFETFNHPINIISSTSLMTSSLPKVTLVDNPSTSTYTASYANCRNYQPSFEAYSNFSNPSFGTPNNTLVGHFLSETGANYSLTPTHSTCLGYDNHYKLPTVDTLAFQPQTQSQVVTSSWPATSNNTSFKSITSSIVDGFNTCIELEYTNIGAANLPTTLNNSTFPEATHPRFSNSFP